MGGMLKLAVADAVLTFLWVFSIATLGTASSLVSSALNVQGAPTLLITTALVSLLVFLFTFLGQALGGASFNPTGTASFYAAGVGSGSLFSIAVRLPAQAAGAVGGALAIMEFMPSEYKKNLRGPSLKVDLHTGAIAEGVLTFIISFLVLCIVLKGPRNMLLKTWLIAISTVSLVVVGSSYTGPAMNPANAFGWAYVNNRHNTWEQFYVYWICPFVGAIVAAWVFRIIFPLPVKQKKA